MLDTVRQNAVGVEYGLPDWTTIRPWGASPWAVSM
jgi:hypothetical protein